jgi:hypothetical protein
MDLAPGEKTTGVITGKGAFTPKYVTCTDGLFGDDVRGDVSRPVSDCTSPRALW